MKNTYIMSRFFIPAVLLGLSIVMGQPLYAQDVAKEYDLQEVEVTARRHDFGARSPQMSAIAISADRIKKLPVLMGEVDILKSLQTMPGVQSGGEGRSGIFVRGGDYDQNLFLLDGITLYNPEHLQGFTSAVNADLMNDVVLYKGAFPSRFGSRLSSVIDIGLREGDMRDYHASVTAGMLASRVQAEGPLWKGHTSFNIGARASYFNAIVSPLLKEVVYDNPGQMNNFSHMRYFDVNAKLTHRFNEKARLNAVFYYGFDENNTTPNETAQHFEYSTYASDRQAEKTSVTDNVRRDRTLNEWKNLLGGIGYTHTFSPRLQMEAGASYSGYRYSLSQISSEENDVSLDLWGYGAQGAMPYSHKSIENAVSYRSEIDDFTARINFTASLSERNELRLGAQGGAQLYRPAVSSRSHSYLKQARNEDIIWQAQLGDDRFTFSESERESLSDGDFRLLQVSAFAEDEWTPFDRLKVSMGIRLQGYSADGKTHLELEPRLSTRLLMTESLALKVSYARMSQGAFLLTSGSMVSPSEVWIPINGGLEPGISDQVSAGLSKDFDKGIQLSVEGYYKWMDNVTDYRDGMSLVTARGFCDPVAQGRGKAYGLEFLAEKTSGDTRGHISYTWSKSLRKFDRTGMEINGGREFYAAGDRRHNLSISVTQRLSRNWDLSASWTYQSGRRTNIAATVMSGGLPDEYNAYNPGWKSTDMYNGIDYSGNPDYNNYSETYPEGTYLQDLVRMDTYGQRNSYTLPAVHRLDVSLSHHGSIGIGELTCDIGIYNLYNRQNISSVYWGYTNNRLALKGVCLFPIMPSISLTLKL